MTTNSILTLFRPLSKKLNKFQTVQAMTANFIKFMWNNFKVTFTCTSTVTLSWQPNVDSHVFYNLHLPDKKVFLLFLLVELLHYINLKFQCNPGSLVANLGKKYMTLK